MCSGRAPIWPAMSRERTLSVTNLLAFLTRLGKSPLGCGPRRRANARRHDVGETSPGWHCVRCRSTRRCVTTRHQQHDSLSREAIMRIRPYAVKARRGDSPRCPKLHQTRMLILAEAAHSSFRSRTVNVKVHRCRFWEDTDADSSPPHLREDCPTFSKLRFALRASGVFPDTLWIPRKKRVNW